jgi:CheY-like chemotaxis protein
MQANNLQQEQSCLQAQHSLSVLPLGLGSAIEAKLKNFFQLNRQAGRCYRVVSPHTTEPVDILLVNYDNADALQQRHLLATQYPNTPSVALSQGPLPSAPDYHIRGLLTVSRLFAVLDQIPVSVPAAMPRPLELVPAAAKPLFITPPVAPAPLASQERYRALVVDDSVAIQKSLELKLVGLAQIAGIDFADSGESALEKVASQHYDLIFLDVMMPGIDGYETCTRLRKQAAYKKTPIIMVSGKTSPLDEVKGVMAGCTTYLTKPVQDEAFHKLSLRVLAWLADRKPA